MELIENISGFGFFVVTPAVAAWRAALDGRASLRGVAVADQHRLLHAFLVARGAAHVSALMERFEVL